LPFRRKRKTSVDRQISGAHPNQLITVDRRVPKPLWGICTAQRLAHLPCNDISLETRSSFRLGDCPSLLLLSISLVCCFSTRDPDRFAVESERLWSLVHSFGFWLGFCQCWTTWRRQSVEVRTQQDCSSFPCPLTQRTLTWLNRYQHGITSRSAVPHEGQQREERHLVGIQPNRQGAHLSAPRRRPREHQAGHQNAPGLRPERLPCLPPLLALSPSRKALTSLAVSGSNLPRSQNYPPRSLSATRTTAPSSPASTFSSSTWPISSPPRSPTPV
jgi:hypothetical protein